MIIALNFIALPDTQAAGAYRYISNMLKMLQFYEISDTQFIIYKQKHIPDDFFGVPKNVNVQYINVPSLGRGIKRIIFEQTLFYLYLLKCDVFYSYCTSMPLFVRARKIFTLHDVYSFSSDKRHGLLQRLYLRLTTRAYVWAADHIITVSQFSKKEIQHYLHVPDNLLSITYNFLLPKQKITSQSVNASYSKPYFLFVGSLLPHKNIQGMVDGFITFNKDHKYELRIVGACHDDILKTYLQNKKDVLYLGFQSDEEIYALYKNCKGVVLLSFCEGFGIPPIEGFQYNKPALVANAASLPEVVGKAGIKVNPYDIEEIANGYQSLVDQNANLTKYIPEQLQKFDPNTSCETFMDVLGIKYQRI